MKTHPIFLNFKLVNVQCDYVPVPLIIIQPITLKKNKNQKKLAFLKSLLGWYKIKSSNCFAIILVLTDHGLSTKLHCNRMKQEGILQGV